MKSIALKMAGPGGPSSYNSHIPIQLNMHHNFGLVTKIKTARTRVGIRAACMVVGVYYLSASFTASLGTICSWKV